MTTPKKTAENDFFSPDLFVARDYVLPKKVKELIDQAITRRRNGEPISIAPFARKLQSAFDLPISPDSLIKRIKRLAGGSW